MGDREPPYGVADGPDDKQMTSVKQGLCRRSSSRQRQIDCCGSPRQAQPKSGEEEVSRGEGGGSRDANGRAVRLRTNQTESMCLVLPYSLHLGVSMAMTREREREKVGVKNSTIMHTHTHLAHSQTQAHTWAHTRALSTPLTHSHGRAQYHAPACTGIGVEQLGGW